MATRSRSRVAPAKEDVLPAEIDATADLLPDLLIETRRQMNAAINADDLERARTLRLQAAAIANALQLFLRREIKAIDDGAEMKRLIAQLSAINADIRTIISAAQQAAQFLKQLTAITAGLNTVAGKLLK
ncbi:MAG: hypothetical protein AB7O45_17275 [Alphaproteobacteria bacterium]